ncbi:energy transducer TonB [Iodobacter ciconiae]|uniref:Energy transducer TonB n=1 Tax=Iodobacter ciconiae TaxID=2496266 RepID=A0A3S8ZQS3_9NEIS|nr:energy transducer TonB [Iodobacter ciconiae]AZN35840.1 energy transducer TonB [Iodobacter ciconiae]
MIINKILVVAVALLGHSALLYGLTTMSVQPAKPKQVVMLLTPSPVPMGEDVVKQSKPQAKPRSVTRPQALKPRPAPAKAVSKVSETIKAPEQAAAGQMAAVTQAIAPAEAIPAPATAGSKNSKQISDEVPVETPPLFNTSYLANPRPSYPAQSMALGEKGRVMLRVKVSELGLPIEVELARSSGYRRLDDAARKAVERWKFVPGRRGDVAVVMSAMVPVDFVI